MALPNNAEQEMLQLINRFRADPAGEAGRITGGVGMTDDERSAVGFALGFFGVDLVLFAQQMAALSPAAPLAWSTQLEDAAAAHSAAMIAADSQSHQLPGEDGLGTRIAAAGYSFSSAGRISMRSRPRRPMRMPGSWWIGAAAPGGCRRRRGIG